VALTAEIRFPPVTYRHPPDPHRKGILMFRQTLDSGGIYAAAAVHGSGMTALQYRRSAARAHREARRRVHTVSVD
jgi:hypothetical protein